MPVGSDLRQESVVEVGERELTVVSEVLLEPEAMIVTHVKVADAVVKKSHVVLPAASVQEYAARGPAALAPSLHAHHLRFLRSLLASDDRPGEASGPIRAGVIATLVLGESGEVVGRAGEEHVPGGWLRAAYLVAGIGEMLPPAMALGRLRRAAVIGGGVSAVLVRDGAKTRVSFVDPDALSVGTADGLEKLLGEIA
jgi:hypothetical protein